MTTNTEEATSNPSDAPICQARTSPNTYCTEVATTTFMDCSSDTASPMWLCSEHARHLRELYMKDSAPRKYVKVADILEAADTINHIIKLRHLAKILHESKSPDPGVFLYIHGALEELGLAVKLEEAVREAMCEFIYNAIADQFLSLQGRNIDLNPGDI